MQVEQWVPMTSIPEVAGWYEISDHGRIRYAAGAPANVRVRGYKSTHITGNGYCYVNIHHSGKQHGYRLYRLVAMEFVPNPNGYKEVNHIDGDKTNNAASNLEWCDRSANMRHSFDTLGQKAHRWTEEEKAELSRKSKEWYAAHPREKQTEEEKKEKRRAYHEKHREFHNNRSREYYYAHKSEYRARERELYRRKKEAKKAPTA